jgi:hypothetical protein
MPRPGSEPVEVEAKYLHFTPDAVLIEVEGRQIWVSVKNGIHEDNEFDWEDAERGDSCTITIKQWLAEKEGLE